MMRILSPTPKNCFCGVVLVIAALAFCLPAEAKTCYVDKGNLGGTCNNSRTRAENSITTPWCRIQECTSKLIAGDTCSIRAETYYEVIDQNTSGGGTGSRITFENYGSETVTIDGTGGSDTGYGRGQIDLQSVDHIVIRGLRIVMSMDNGIGIRYADDIHIEDCYIHRTKDSCIFARDSTNIYIDNNELSRCNAREDDSSACEGNEDPFLCCDPGTGQGSCGPCVRTGRAEGNRLGGNNQNSIDGFEFTNNEISSPGFGGLQLVNATDGIVRGNEFNDDGGCNPDKGALTFDGGGYSCSPYASCGNSSILVEKNLFDWDYLGIKINIESVGGRNEDIDIFNNIIYGGDSSGMQLMSERGSGGSTTPWIYKDIQIAHNTIYNKAGAGLDIEIWWFENSSIHNNIVSECGNQINRDGAPSEIEDSQNTNIAINNNLFEGDNEGTNTIITDPDFTNEGSNDFTLKSTSDAIDAGIGTGTLPSDDYAGDSRPQGSGYDIGAYEFSSATGPVRSNFSPTFPARCTVDPSTIEMSLSTNVDSTCKYDTDGGEAYSAMANTFSTTGGTSHSQNVSQACGAFTTYYIRCTDGVTPNLSDVTIAVEVSGGAEGAQPPPVTLSSGGELNLGGGGALDVAP